MGNKCKLTYSVATSPDVIRVSTKKDPNQAKISIVASNNTDEAIEVDQISFSLDIGENAAQLTASGLIKCITELDEWQITSDENGSFTARPVKGKYKIIKGQGLGFHLLFIIINTEIGTADLRIKERLVGERRSNREVIQIAKFPGTFVYPKLRIEDPTLDINQSATVLWNKSSDCTYYLEYRGKPMFKVEGSSYTTEKLTENKVFTLTAEYIKDGQRVSYMEQVSVEIFISKIFVKSFKAEPNHLIRSLDSVDDKNIDFIWSISNPNKVYPLKLDISNFNRDKDGFTYRKEGGVTNISYNSSELSKIDNNIEMSMICDSQDTTTTNTLNVPIFDDFRIEKFELIDSEGNPYSGGIYDTGYNGNDVINIIAKTNIPKKFNDVEEDLISDVNLIIKDSFSSGIKSNHSLKSVMDDRGIMMHNDGLVNIFYSAISYREYQSEDDIRNDIKRDLFDKKYEYKDNVSNFDVILQAVNSRGDIAEAKCQVAFSMPEIDVEAELNLDSCYTKLKDIKSHYCDIAKSLSCRLANNREIDFDVFVDKITRELDSIFAKNNLKNEMILTGSINEKIKGFVKIKPKKQDYLDSRLISGIFVGNKVKFSRIEYDDQIAFKDPKYCIDFTLDFQYSGGLQDGHFNGIVEYCNGFRQYFDIPSVSLVDPQIYDVVFDVSSNLLIIVTNFTQEQMKQCDYQISYKYNEYSSAMTQNLVLEGCPEEPYVDFHLEMGANRVMTHHGIRKI